MSEPAEPHSTHRLFFVAALGANVALALVLQKGWIDFLPDGLVAAICLIPIIAFLWWLWIHPGIKKWRYLLYTRPKMSLVTMMALFGLIGIAVGGFLWWATSRQERASVTSSQSTHLGAEKDIPANGGAVNEVAMPAFPESAKVVRITTRGQHFTIPLSFLEGDDRNYSINEKVTGGFPITVHVKDRKPYIDAKVYTEAAGFVEIKNNKLVAKPEGWDENANDRAIEIVNEKQQVVFQAILMSSEHIDIEGYFSKFIAETMRYDRIFKYPSSEHRGELVENLDLLPLTSKSLYTLFLEGCPGKATSHGSYMLKGEERELKIEVMECADLDTRAFYLSTFIPNPLDPEQVIRQLAIEYKEIIRRYGNGAGFVRMRPGERPERSEGLTPTGLINIYYEGILDSNQARALEQELIKQGATTVRFYDSNYVITRNSPLYPK